MPKHIVVHPTSHHKQRVDVLRSDIWGKSPEMLNAWLEDNVKTVEDARKVLATIILAVGQSVSQKG